MELNYKKIWHKIIESKKLEEEDTAIVFYSLPTLKKQLKYLKSSFDKLNPNILHTVAIKTNPHPAILNCIAKEGYGLEAASFEEVQLALKTGIQPDKIIFNSPVKTKREIEYCINNLGGIHLNANSLEELERIPKDNNLTVGLRINPNVQVSTADLYNVSKKTSKFGVPINQKEKIIKALFAHRINTLHVHVGSQVSNFKESVKGLKLVFQLAETVNALASDISRKVTTINIGGGISAGETIEENKRNMENYISLIQKEIPEIKNKYNLITEFGQWTHKFNGLCFSRIEYIKKLEENYSTAFTHLGGDFFMREIYTNIKTLSFEIIKNQGIREETSLDTGKMKKYDIAGPLCFNGDFLIKGVELPELFENDILVIKNTGANTNGLWSIHCSRTFPKFCSDRESDNQIEVLNERMFPFAN